MRRAIAIAGLVALVVALLIVSRRERISPRRVAMAAVHRSSRPVEARLTGGFRYAPFLPSADPSVVGGPTHPAEPEANEADQRYADRGVSDLLDGYPGKAVPRLEAAVLRDPKSARHLSDLAAALLERAVTEDDTQDLVRALGSALRALELKPRLQEALFNRALALERLFLRSEAARAWEDYLAQDSDSGWAKEAETRKNAQQQLTPAELWVRVAPDLDGAAAAADIVTVRSIVRKYPQQARQRAEEHYLPDWASAYRAGSTAEAARALVRARVVGAALAERGEHGEHLASDAVAVIDAALGAPADPSRALALADGHLEVKEGRRLQIESKLILAGTTLGHAAEHLRSGGSPFAAWADLYQAICFHDGVQDDEARPILRRLVADPDMERSPSLAGRIHWVSGLIHFRSADPSSALVDYGRALEKFEQGGELGNAGAVHVFFAEALTYLGEERQAWRHRGLALRLLPETSEPKRRQNVLEEAEPAVRAEEPKAALPFRESALAEARRYGKPVAISFALQQRALLRHQTGDHDGASQDLKEAKLLLSKVFDANLAVAEGEIELEEEPRNAAKRLRKALTFFEAKKSGVRRLEVLLLLSKAEGRAGDEDSAEKDLKAGLDEAERQRARVTDEELRSTYFARMQPLFDLLIASAMDRGEVPEALDLAERARARPLLDRLGGAGPEPGQPPLTSSDLQLRLPPGVAVIEYASLDDRLCLWVLRRNRIESHTVKAEKAHRKQLARQIQSLRALLVGGVDTPGARDLARRLYETVVQPALVHSKPEETLIFVPDKSLNDLPFAALVDPNGHFLVEDHPIGVAPSANLWVCALDRDRRLAAHPVDGALLVGNPAFNGKLFPGLDPLPESDAEVKKLARLYSADRVLTLLGPDATRQRFLQEIGRFRVVQFSGHSQINPQEPRRSRLALAPSSGDSGVLYARDLQGLGLEGPRLVVLAACSTGLRETAGAEGFSGLTRAFLAAGIPAVVASLWDVRDNPGTSKLITELHRHLLKRESPFSALRAAQLSLLTDKDHPAFHDPRLWAAFQVFGGAVPNPSAASR